jgi:preprotein translocase subunit SecG
MYLFLTILLIFISILLILVVLVQNPKGGGLSAGFNTTQVMGIRKTVDIVEKLTWGFAGAIIFFSLVASLSLPQAGDKSTITIRSGEKAKELPNAPALPQGATQQGNPLQPAPNNP